MTFSISMAALQRRCPARVFWPLVAIWSAWAVLFWPTLQGMAAIWLRSETFAHGWLIFPISYFLIWRCQLTRPPRSSSGGLLVGLAGGTVAGLIWLSGQLIHVQAAQQLGALVALWALSGAYLGLPLLRQLWFPFGFMIFAVPFGEFLIPQLQQLTAAMAVTLLRWSQIPVYVEGLYLYTPRGIFEVAVACSGIRYLIASLALGTLYAYLNYRSHWRRLAFVGLSFLLPLLANGVRAYGIIVIAFLSQMRYAVGVDHLIYGWLFFGVVMWLLFWLGSAWTEPAECVDTTRSAPEIRDWRALVSVLLVFMLLGGMRWWHQNPAPTAQWMLTASSMPKLGRWRPVEIEPSDGLGRFRGMDVEVNRAYSDGNRRVLLYLAIYHREQQHRELVNSSNRAFDEKWRLIGRELLPLTLDGVERPWPVLILRNHHAQRLLLGGYWVDGAMSSGAAETKLRQLWAGLRGHQGGAYIGVYVPFRDDSAQAMATLRAFVSDGWPALQALLLRPGASLPEPSLNEENQYAGF